MLTTIRRSLFLPQLIIILSVVAIFMTGQDEVPAASLVLRRGSANSQEAAPVKLGTNLVSVHVTVTDRSGRAIEGLRKENFKVYEDNVEQPISFFSEEDAPASIGIILDISNSMNESKIEHAREALGHFIRTSHEEDEFFLISFNSSPQLLLDGVRDGQAVLDRFNKVSTGGNTALYDAVYLGIEKVSRGRYPKRTILLISDGEDNRSRFTFKQIRRRLQESDVTIYTIRTGLALPHSNGPMIMGQLASVSGGRAFSPGNTDQMDEAFEKIALELRRQYSIGYLPTNFAADSKWHRIKVTLTVPGNSSRLVVRSREGYFAVKDPDKRRFNLGMRH